MELKQPPHSVEAEQSLIGGILLDNEAFDRVSWLQADAFYAHRHKLIWSAIGRLIESGKPADLVTIPDFLGADLDKVDDGAAYIAALAQNAVSAANVHRYAEMVHSKHVFRQLALKGMEIAERGFAGSGDHKEAAEEAEVSILSVLGAQGGAAHEVAHVGKAAVEYVEWTDNHPKGIECGLSALDGLTGGLLPGNLVVIAGRPHMGKTALALQCAEHICTTSPGLMFSLESSRREMAGRLIEWHKHRVGRDAALDKVFNLKLFIDDTSAVSPAVMRSRLRRMKRQHGLSVVVVDYLQLVRGKGDSREQEVAYISRELKSIAKDFAVPVIALAQLNRKVEERADKRPHMSDLRESGAIEQDADLVMLLYRPDYYDTEFAGNMAEAEIHVPKNRNNGRNGLVKVMFSRELGRFGDWLPERFRTGAA